MTERLLTGHSAHTNTPLFRLLPVFLDERAHSGTGVRTATEYSRLLRRFLAIVEAPDGLGPYPIHQFAYGPGPTGRAPAPATIRVRLAAISGFLDFAWRMGIIAGNPARQVLRPRGRPSRPASLAQDEVRALLDVIPHSASGLHDRAVILLILLTGLRREEALRLRRVDIEWRNEIPRVGVRVKGGWSRSRELPDPAYMAIEAQLSAVGRRLETMQPDERIFRVSGTTLGRRLHRYAADAALDASRVSPHALRHTAARLRRDAGASIEEVRQLLGHRSLATTAIYLSQLEGESDLGWPGVAAMLEL